MGSQAVFKRYELKYMLTKEQYLRIMNGIEPYSLVGEFMNVRITGADEYDLIAEPLEIL